MPTPQRCALVGSSGVGKTQLACRYASLFRNAYAGVFWVSGATPQELQTQLASLAPELVPPVPTLANQQATFQAVLQWFDAQEGWLLVVDNVANLSDLTDLDTLLPPSGNGRVLLITSATSAPIPAPTVNVDRLDEEAGALLLLYYARALPYTRPLEAADLLWQTGARAISREVNGLPLACAQAGTYLAQQSLVPQKYLSLYRAHASRLTIGSSDPNRRTIAITTAMALEQGKRLPRIGRYVEELALYGAFLGADLLPNEIILRGKAVTKELAGSPGDNALDALDVTEVREALCAYGLARRVPALAALWIYGLTRTAVRENLPIQAQGEAAALYATALPLLRQLHGSQHPEVAACLGHLARVYIELERFTNAEALLQEALSIGRRTVGRHHTMYAARLLNLSACYIKSNRPYEAKSLLTQALSIREQAHGSDHPEVAECHYWRGRMHYTLGNLGATLAAFRRAWEIRESALEPQHPDTVTARSWLDGTQRDLAEADG